jgi:hypothetical protein
MWKRAIGSTVALHFSAPLRFSLHMLVWVCLLVKYCCSVSAALYGL